MTNLLLSRPQIGFYSGLTLFFIILLMPQPADMSNAAQSVAAIAALMATWWITEAVPLPVTALLPVVLFPALDVMSVSAATAPYANHIIFLFLGGFIIALCIERWNLHKRIALHTIYIIGHSPKRILLGFILATAFLSMWISNTATALMMLPVALAVVKNIDETGESVFGMTLMLGIAYAASIGGVATLIGTPPNAILAGVLEQQAGLTISFFEWMVFAFPLAFMFLLIAWRYLCWLQRNEHVNLNQVEKSFIRNQLQQLGKLSLEEKKILIVFLLVAGGWVAREFIDIQLFRQIKDSTIAIFGAILLFLIPANNNTARLMDWETTKKLPWDILILFGGGFALALGFSESGLTHWLGSHLTFLRDVHLVAIVAVVALLVIFLTEITSNTATASLLIPLMVALSETLNLPPILLMSTVAIAASYAFMLPVATPPNAIVYSSRCVTIQQMAKTGFVLNILGCILITMFIAHYLPIIFL